MLRFVSQLDSAEWPSIFNDALTPNPLGATSDEIIMNTLRLCGYGMPHPENALSANSHCFVFQTEDSLTWGEEDVSSSNLYSGKVSFYTVRLETEDLRSLPPGMIIRVKVTLAYNPPVRKNYRRQYQGVELHWDLRRAGQSIEDFQAKWLAEAEKENPLVDDEITEDQSVEEYERKKQDPSWPWCFRPVLNPNNSKRRGTIISDWFETHAIALPETLDIAILGTVAKWLKPPPRRSSGDGSGIRQNFALVVSIETRNIDLPIYDMVRVKNIIQVKAKG